LRVLVAFGTRPEAIKMAPIIQALRSEPANFEVITCVTAQHREMLDQVLDFFRIIPDVDLNVMSSKQDLSSLTALILTKMANVLTSHRPDIVLVQGDTTTALAVSLACFYQRIKLAHVEAGLRTYNKDAPFPEEMNRQLITRIADVHYAPTNETMQRLVAEGISKDAIFLTGNTVVDSLFSTLSRIAREDELRSHLNETIKYELGFDFQKTKYVLVTGHRRENFGKGMSQICESLVEITAKYPELKIVYPVHLNPQVQEPVTRSLKNQKNIRLVRPLSYPELVQVLKYCHCVLTDSGGIQEEAPSLGKPVLLMRDTTERPEGVEAGTAVIVGTDRNQIVSWLSTLIDDHEVYGKMSKIHNPFGDGSASRIICDHLKRLMTHERA
jgi:UDP-N-acetylglucosamine 2-epimerase (non-hydrolysing)